MAKPKPITFPTIKPKVNQARKFRILFAQVRRYQLAGLAVNPPTAKLKNSKLMGATYNNHTFAASATELSLCSVRFDGSCLHKFPQ